MTVFLWILVALVVWFSCGYFAAKITYGEEHDTDLAFWSFVGGPVTLAFFGFFEIVDYFDNEEFWSKFLRVKDKR